MKRRIRIELDKDVSDALKQYCKDKGLTKSEVVERAIREGLESGRVQKIIKRLSKNAK